MSLKLLCFTWYFFVQFYNTNQSSLSFKEYKLRGVIFYPISLIFNLKSQKFLFLTENDKQFSSARTTNVTSKLRQEQIR